jgi:hypothetical protein
VLDDSLNPTQEDDKKDKDKGRWRINSKNSKNKDEGRIL